jgi:hypothetical protein
VNRFRSSGCGPKVFLQPLRVTTTKAGPDGVTAP